MHIRGYIPFLNSWEHLRLSCCQRFVYLICFCFSLNLLSLQLFLFEILGFFFSINSYEAMNVPLSFILVAFLSSWFLACLKKILFFFSSRTQNNWQSKCLLKEIHFALCFMFLKTHICALLLSFWLSHMHCRILVLWPGVEPGPSAVKAQSPNLPGNSPNSCFFNVVFFIKKIY